MDWLDGKVLKLALEELLCKFYYTRYFANVVEKAMVCMYFKGRGTTVHGLSKNPSIVLRRGKDCYQFVWQFEYPQEESITSKRQTDVRLENIIRKQKIVVLKSGKSHRQESLLKWKKKPRKVGNSQRYAEPKDGASNQFT